MDRWVVDNEPSRRHPLYTRGSIAEVYPLPVTPLTWTLGAVHGAEPGWRDALVRFGAFDHAEFDDTPEVMGCFGGYGYLNLSISRILAVRTPGMTPADFDRSLRGAVDGVPPYESRPGDESPRHSQRIAETIGWVLGATELPEVDEDRRWVDQCRARRPNLATRPATDLVADIRAVLPELRRLFAQHLFVSYCALAAVTVLHATCDEQTALAAMSGIGGVASAEPALEMWDLARLARASPAIAAEFDRGVDGLLDRLRARPDATALLDGLDHFLYDYGSRGPNEWEPSSPSWEAAPELVLAAIDDMRMLPESSSPATTHRQVVAARDQLLRTAPDQGFASAARSAQLFLRGRERTKANVTRVVNEVRMALLELGGRMVDAGHLDRREDLLMVVDDELDGFIAEPAALAPTIRERSVAYRSLFDLEPPFVLGRPPPPLDQWPRRSRAAAAETPGTVLAGIPAGLGLARGRARVVLDPTIAGRLQPGDILVAPLVDPAWTPLFVAVSAVVVDVGAQLSHAVIVARELGVPCVVSVANATRRIPDGSQIAVDGGAGTVTLLE